MFNLRASDVCIVRFISNNIYGGGAGNKAAEANYNCFPKGNHENCSWNYLSIYDVNN